MQITTSGAFSKHFICHGSVDCNSLHSLYFDLVYILLIMYTVFLYIRKHKWKEVIYIQNLSQEVACIGVHYSILPNEGLSYEY